MGSLLLYSMRIVLLNLKPFTNIHGEDFVSHLFSRLSDTPV